MTVSKPLRHAPAVAPSSSKQEALLRAAVELFSSRPYEDVSVDEIARRADVAHGLVSYYFGSKRGLFGDAVAFVWADFIQFERPRVEESTPTRIVRGFLRRHFQYARRYPERSALMRSTSTDPSVNRILDLAKAEAMDEITAALGCPTHTPALLATAIWGWQSFIETVTARWLANPDLDIEELTEMCVQVLVAMVNAANGSTLSPEFEAAALTQVAGPPAPPARGTR